MAMQKLIIITAPSGAGKTTITKYLLEKYPALTFSISAATRQARAGEIDGKDYYFIPVEEFRQKMDEDAFVEWEMVYEGKYYGTLKSEMQRIWDGGRIPVLDIDVQGAIHVEEKFAKGTCLLIFIKPPSIEELRRRLESRQTDDLESIKTRMSKAEYEMSFTSHFNKVIVNDNLERACHETEEVIKEFLGWK